MSETINVNPTPIQRNSADVAIELTERYFKTYGCEGVDEISKVYVQFFATAEFCRLNYRNLDNFVPDEIIKAFKR